MGQMLAVASEIVSVVDTIVSLAKELFSKRPPAPPIHVLESTPQVVNKSPRQIIEEARKTMGVDCINFYNVVVCGNSGVGKSAFVNGVLSLKGNEACAVGEVETTRHIKSYTSNKYPHLKLWDIPGAGTKLHPAATYFEDKKLYVFDAILILSCDRFLDVDFDILRAAQRYGTPCAFVRTKCDISVVRRAKRDKVNAVEASQRLREDVSKSFHEGVEKAGLNAIGLQYPRLFFISNEFFSFEGDDEGAYSIFDRKTKSMDNSLYSMDEQSLIVFVVNASRRTQ